MIPARLKLLRRLKKNLPGEIFLEPATLEKYSGDKWLAVHQPDAVALPRSTKSVATILRFANQNKIPVTARGGGYGYVGGCVPVEAGIALSLARMNRIKEISFDDAIAIANDTLYGLGAGVWSRDGNTAYKAGRAIKAGRVWTNCYHLYPAGAAFGGYKQSGIGRENHRMMLDHYQQTKNLLVSYSPKKLGFF